MGRAGDQLPIAWVSAAMTPGYAPEQAAQIVRTAMLNPGTKVAFDSCGGHGDRAVLLPVQEEI